MKIKDLIKELQSFKNPELNVNIYAATEGIQEIQDIACTEYLIVNERLLHGVITIEGAIK